MTTEEISVNRKGDVFFNDELVGRVVKTGTRNMRDALNLQGEVVAKNCYANGGADGAAAFHLVIRLGLLKRGARHIVRHPDGFVAGPYTFAGEMVAANETPLERAYRLGEGCGGLDADGVKRIMEISNENTKEA